MRDEKKRIKSYGKIGEQHSLVVSWEHHKQIVEFEYIVDPRVFQRLLDKNKEK